MFLGLVHTQVMMYSNPISSSRKGVCVRLTSIRNIDINNMGFRKRPVAIEIMFKDESRNSSAFYFNCSFFRVLSANKVDLGFFVSSFVHFYPPPPRCCSKLGTVIHCSP